MEFEPIAIVGRSCLFPGASTPEQLWNVVSTGQCTVSTSPQNRWRVPKEAIISDESRSPGRAYTDRGGYVSGFASLFDPRGFALHPNEIQRHDEMLRWVLHTGREALRNAGINAPEHTPAPTGAIFGLRCVPT